MIDERGIRWHFAWTRSFIRDFGWREYWRVCWRDTWIYRFRNWRCWFGHELGPEEWSYEEGFRYEGWRSCQRPRCEYCERVD